MWVRVDRALQSDFAAGKLGPDDRPVVSLVLKGTFDMRSDGAPVVLCAEQSPVLTVDSPYPDTEPSEGLRLESDRVPFKPLADVVVVGHAHTPQHQPQRVIDARVRVGALDRSIKVIGDRKWYFPEGSREAPRQVGPVEFTRMPLTYDRAFGGIDPHGKVGELHPDFRPWWSPNFAGCGFIGSRSSASIHEKPLPNLEDPGQLIRTFDTWPRPVGFGYYPRNSEPRCGYLGTYDEAWQAERAPELPTDFDPTFWNGAHPDMQVHGYLRGDEEVRLDNLTPGGGTVHFRLPGWAPQVRVEYRAEGVDIAPERVLRRRDGRVLRKQVDAHLDTLVMLPDEGKLQLVWRAAHVYRETDALEILGWSVTTEPTAAATPPGGPIAVGGAAQ